VVTKDLVESFQLVLTMEKWQQQFIQQLCPNISERVLILSQVVGIEKDIIDPVGMSKNNYRGILKEIQSYFEQGWENILLLAKK
jgi:protein-tyrosine-phosphatase